MSQAKNETNGVCFIIVDDVSKALRARTLNQVALLGCDEFCLPDRSRGESWAHPIRIMIFDAKLKDE